MAVPPEVFVPVARGLAMVARELLSGAWEASYEHKKLELAAYIAELENQSNIRKYENDRIRIEGYFNLCVCTIETMKSISTSRRDLISNHLDRVSTMLGRMASDINVSQERFDDYVLSTKNMSPGHRSYIVRRQAEMQKEKAKILSGISEMGGVLAQCMELIGRDGVHAQDSIVHVINQIHKNGV